ncbi:MAG: TlyA family RNA methyltransferase [Clostridium argentinense]|uniref:TlyA family RNA methyltransferase n=1 Tax=Clostridium faecium TaxID=2762223 RepID=A0ABR8YWM7_9CLOT|nr:MULTISPECIES: TlyA family RNA methyltransferase [Clostridium]MBD8048398.1 TlyA family RNA methyltransferase [Clostridium faecium]MBS5823237.1 TlyA family RNA methyltransferase [Clostridium argentinense]MDU1349031.1 TlyA family RNA methyltransferase [Clostridium argentinense]
MCDNKIRLDVLVYNKKIASSREKARDYIINGKIYVDGVKEIKCGKKFPEDVVIEFKGEVLPYVSRGGLKLEKALKFFSIDLEGKTCLDIGASTGGFTDCMLKNKAEKVYAIDVGTNQLVEDLRSNPKVVSMENTNVRYLTFDDIGQYCDFASIDVSFISLKKVIPSVVNLLKEDGICVALIKPQFEVGVGKVNKKGVVKKPDVHKEVIINIVEFLKEIGIKIINLDYSPIKGPNGNIEYLIEFTKSSKFIEGFTYDYISKVVNSSHFTLSTEEI